MDYVLRTSIHLMKESCFTLKKAKTRQYPAETIIDPDNADDLGILAAHSGLGQALSST